MRMPRLDPALAVIALAIALGCSSPEERKAQHLQRAEAFEKQGKIREALIEMRSALKVDPKSATINAEIAELLQEQGDLANALFFWEEAHRLDPDNFRWSLALAKLLLFQDGARAQQIIDEILERDPSNATAHVRRSELALARSDSAKALEAALTAAELAPKDAMVRAHLGVVHRARIRELTALRQPVPDSLREEALATFARAIELGSADPSAPPQIVVRAAYERATVLQEWPGRQKEAAAAFEKAFELASAPVLRQMVLEAALGITSASSDRELRQWALEKQVEVEPARIWAWVELSSLVDAADAEQSPVMERLVSERPTDARAQAAYVYDLAQRKGMEAAAAHVDRIAPQTDAPALVIAELARLYLMRGDVAALKPLAEQLAKQYPNEAETALVRGEVELVSGNYPEAIRFLEQSVERRSSVEAHRLLGEAYFRRGEPRRALDAITKAIQLAGGTPAPDILRTKGRYEAALGDWPAAFQTYVLLRQTGFASEDAFPFARILYEMNRPDAARRILEQLLQSEEPPVEAMLLFVRREGARDPERAQDVLEQAATLYPDHPSVVEQMTRFDFRARKPEEALARLDAAIAKEDSARLRLLRARLHASQGRLDKASEDASKALDMRPASDTALTLMAQLLTAQGKRDEAIASLEKQAVERRLSLSGRVLLGRLYTVSGRSDQAVETFRIVLADRNDLPGVKNDLAYLLAQRGEDLDRALELAREARQGMPASAQVADTLGFVYLKKNLPGPAADQFREALGMLKSDHRAWPTTQYHLGLALKALGKAPEAVEAFEKALAAAIEFPEADAARQELEALRAGGAAQPKG